METGECERGKSKDIGRWKIVSIGRDCKVQSGGDTRALGTKDGETSMKAQKH